ncbi:neuropilin-2-like [Amphiura filiformis]|uniref:neuropilin-2-like n=1 Tax=Amphiura filiformis TaxID=82378 RepID=UPI003B219F91
MATLLPADCPLPLGLESGHITDGQLSASSFIDGEHSPSHGRLRNSSYWRPADNTSQWFQVRFDKRMIVSAISIQGSGTENGGWVTKYELTFSEDGIQWNRPVKREELYKENKDPHCPTPCVIEPPIQAIFLRIHPIEWVNFVALRMEVYGCIDNDCEYPLGMTSNLIPDEDITASSELNSLHAWNSSRIQTWQSQGSGWIPTFDDIRPWIQVYLTISNKIRAVVTQGCRNEDFWVTAYSVTFFLDDVQQQSELGDEVISRAK